MKETKYFLKGYLKYIKFDKSWFIDDLDNYYHNFTSNYSIISFDIQYILKVHTNKRQ